MLNSGYVLTLSDVQSDTHVRAEMEQNSSGVEDVVSTTGDTISLSGSTITFNGDSPMSVFSVDGVLVASGYDRQVVLPCSGIYVVHVGSAVYKIIAK